MGFNNIRTDQRPSIETNLREIADVKNRYAKNLVIASLMVESKPKLARHCTSRRGRRLGRARVELRLPARDE